MKLYLYNEGNNTLHIKNGCTKSRNPDHKQFDSEDEAVAYAGRRLGMCRECMRIRDEILRKELIIKQKKGE